MPSSLHSPFIFFLLLISPCLAQTNRLFQWKFGDGLLSPSLPTCLPLSIVVQSFNTTLNDTQGVPPYYMMSFAVGGTPRTELIGVDNDTISWEVKHPVGTSLMLSVVDSTGSAGGVPPRLFTVVAGQTTQCVIPPPEQSDFTVTSNLTDKVQTCEPWGITVKGGVPPYNVTLAALNSPVVTNVTIPFGYDAFTYIDRADPNGKLLVAVSDLTGRWATGTPLVNTYGSSDVDCVGSVSSYGNSTEIKQQQEEAASQAKNKRRTAIIAGVCAGLGGLVLIIAAGIALYLRRSKRRVPREIEVEPDVVPRQFEVGPLLSIYTSNNSSPNSSPPRRLSKLTRTTNSDPPLSTISSSSGDFSVYRNGPTGNFDPYSIYNQSAQSGAMDTSNSSGTGNSGVSDPTNTTTGNMPLTPLRSGKAARMLAEANTRSNGPMRQAPNAMWTSRPISVPEEPLVEVQGGDGEVIFQHRDAGGVVREVPPPYVMRGSR